MALGVWISLIAYFAIMIGIGVYAYRKSTSSSEEYMLGGRNLPPAVAALSAGASDMSGWLLLGLPGALYAAGLVEAWIGIGLFIGALVNWIVVAPRLREQTERYDNSLTIPAFLANRFPTQGTTLRIISAVIIVVFFAVYTASGLVAGGKLYESAFGGSYMVGIWLTLGIVLVYTVIGGFLAVSLTDFVQGVIMMLALIIMPAFILWFTDGGGGFAQARETLSGIEDFTLGLTTEGMTVIGFLSLMAWGLGYFGQPHIIVRFMAIRSVPAVATARNIGMTWMFIALIGAIGVGILGRAYVERNGISLEDSETIFILLAESLFHPLVTGFLFAALLAAIMSTVSSQLLVSSSSLAEDGYKMLKKDASDSTIVTVGRIAVVAVGVVAAFIASDPDSQVLSLVANAWAGFGAAFGPLMILALCWPRMTGAGAVAGLVTGAAVVILWAPVLGWNSDFMGTGEGVYEMIPGFVLAWLAIYGVSLATEDSGEFRDAAATPAE